MDCLHERRPFICTHFEYFSPGGALKYLFRIEFAAGGSAQQVLMINCRVREVIRFNRLQLVLVLA